MHTVSGIIQNWASDYIYLYHKAKLSRLTCLGRVGHLGKLDVVVT